ncbi:MAG: glycosyltransferase family 39 protein, partial [Acidobacteriota bacterium]
MTAALLQDVKRWPRALWWLILAGLLFRLLALAATSTIDCLMDECAYTHLAELLAAGDGFQPHRRHYWPPGYIAFLAAHIRLGAGILGAKLTQVLLSTGLIPLVFLLARRSAAGISPALCERAALAAAALVALDPTLIAFSHYLWSETLFLPLFTGGLILVLDACRDLSTRRALAAGALLGLACLVKVLPFYLVPLLAVWILARAGGSRRGLAVALALTASTFAVVLPWTLRNTLAYHRVVLIETTLGKNLVRGNNPQSPYNWDWGFQER